MLEERRAFIKQRLSKKNEADLFEVANRFNLRHQGRTQKGDYDEAFLDWVFWSIELPYRLVVRQPTAEDPQREDYDDTLAYYAALRETREGIRERMPDVLRSAVREGDAEGVSRTQTARELGVDPKWLRTQTQATGRPSAPPVGPS